VTPAVALLVRHQRGRLARRAERLLGGGRRGAVAGDVEAEAGNSLYFWHASLGLLVLFLVLVRIIWRFITPVPKHPATMPRLAGRAAAGLHFLFYILLVALPLSGWLASSAEGAPVSFFGVATLPAWTLQASPAANTGGADAGEGGEEFFEEAHEVLGNVLLLLVVLHALAAAGRRGSIERANYLIDRFRVGYQFGGGWTCGCADFAALDACRHTREAAGRRAAQAQIQERITRGSLQAMNSRTGDRAWRPALAPQDTRVDLLVDGVTGAGRALEPAHVEN
jgi:cytochrome b561